MIKNEKQYKISKSWLKDFEAGLKTLDALPANSKKPWLKKAQRGSLQGQMEQLRQEIEEYEALKSGKIKVTLPSVDAIMELPTLLIKRRIANGWTQEQLAAKLNMHGQQLQRYEQTDYASASLATIQRVAEALCKAPPSSRTSKPSTAKSRSAASSKARANSSRRRTAR